MVQHYNDYDKGIHPVNLGLAPYVTGPFREAMQVIRSAVNHCTQQATEKNRAGRRG